MKLTERPTLLLLQMEERVANAEQRRRGFVFTLQRFL